MKDFKLRDVVFILVGFIISVIIMGLLWPKRIAKLSNGEEAVATTSNFNITADDIYKELKNYYGVNALINILDRNILELKYQLTEEEIKDINENAQYYFEMHEQNYGMSKEDFLKQNGFKSEEDFIKYLKLDYMRTKYYNDYLESMISDKDIQEYYDNNVFEPFNVEHILVKITTDLTDSEAKTKANKILNELKSGSTFEDLKNKYKDEIVNEIIKIDFTTSIDESFFAAAKKLKDGDISKELVKSSYGYHIILRKDTLEKPTLNDVKDKIIDKLKDLLKEDEKNSYANVLIKMRNDNKLRINDTEISKEYNEYLKELEN